MGHSSKTCSDLNNFNIHSQWFGIKKQTKKQLYITIFIDQTVIAVNSRLA